MDDVEKEVHLAGPTIKKVSSNTAPEPMTVGDQESMTGEDPVFESELEEMLYARHVEVESFQDLKEQRGTAIPALFNQFYKYIQNPSSISVETFKRMVDTDSTIGSGIDFLTTCLAARIGPYQHPNDEITQFVNKAFGKLDGGWNNAQKELLSAAWAGYAIGEKVWQNDEMGFILKKIVTLPPSTILFETDRVGELTSDGILQYQRNYNPALFGTGPSYLFGFIGNASNGPDQGSFRNDPASKFGDMPFPLRTANTFSYLSIRIQKLKCIHYAFDAQGKFGNPYGRSLLRRCAKFYYMKDAILQMLTIALDRKGTPLTVIFADPNATLADGSKTQQGVSNQGRQVGIRADLAAQNAFKNIHNDSTIILPGKRDQIFGVDFVEQHSNASDFIQALDFCNKEIMRALLLPALVFTGGDGSGSYALGQEHARTFDKILDGILSGFKQCLLDQVIHEMLAYNFPREMWQDEGLGEFGKRELTQEERDKELAALETAHTMGALDMEDLEDLNHVRGVAGLKDRTTPIPKMDDLFGEEDGSPGDSGEGDKGRPPKDTK